MMSSKLKTSIRKRNKTYTKHLQCMVEGLLRYGNIDPTGKSPEEIEQEINSYMDDATSGSATDSKVYARVGHFPLLFKTHELLLAKAITRCLAYSMPCGSSIG
jgi:hypothetical protein